MNNTSNSKSKWYDNNSLVWLLLIVFYPVGVYGMWRNKSFSSNLKKVISSIAVVVTIYALNGDSEIKNGASAQEKVEDHEVTVDSDVSDKIARSSPAIIKDDSCLRDICKGFGFIHHEEKRPYEPYTTHYWYRKTKKSLGKLVGDGASLSWVIDPEGDIVSVSIPLGKRSLAEIVATVGSDVESYSKWEKDAAIVERQSPFFRAAFVHFLVNPDKCVDDTVKLVGRGELIQIKSKLSEIALMDAAQLIEENQVWKSGSQDQALGNLRFWMHSYPITGTELIYTVHFSFDKASIVITTRKHEENLKKLTADN